MADHVGWFNVSAARTLYGNGPTNVDRHVNDQSDGLTAGRRIPLPYEAIAQP